MKGAYRNECTKIMLKKKYTVFLIIGVLIALISMLIGSILAKSLSFITDTLIAWEFGFTPTAPLPFFINLMLPLLIFMCAGDLFTSENTDLTIRASLVRPITRFELYTAKILAILTYIAVYLGVIFAVSTIASFISGGISDFWVLFRAICAYSITLIPMFVMIAFSVLIAQCFHSDTFVMFILIFSMFLFFILPIILPVSGLERMMFTNYLGWYNLWIGSIPSFSSMSLATLLLVSYGTVFYIGGSLIFENKGF